MTKLTITLAAIFTVISCQCLYGQLAQIHPELPAQPNPGAINIVVLGDGYTANQLGAGGGQNIFAIEASQFLDEFLNISPLTEYRNYFNVYRIDKASTTSGILQNGSILPGSAYGCNLWGEMDLQQKSGQWVKSHAAKFRLCKKLWYSIGVM